MNDTAGSGTAWLEVLNPAIQPGRVRHALFDFDGTLSVIRRGWEKVMVALMVEMICGQHPPTPEIVAEVAAYVDESTGILTIEQMRWLERAVRRYGLNPQPMTAQAYKRIYNERLLEPVRERTASIGESDAARDSLMLAGARALLEALQSRGVVLYLASGTDHVYVMEEAQALGIAGFFGDRIYGARDDTEAYTKERVIQQILEQQRLAGPALLVAGDGPVEIRAGKAHRALTLGVAVDEQRREGLDARKRRRLQEAGADIIVSTLTHPLSLTALLAGA